MLFCFSVYLMNRWRFYRLIQSSDISAGRWILSWDCGEKKNTLFVYCPLWYQHLDIWSVSDVADPFYTAINMDAKCVYCILCRTILHLTPDNNIFVLEAHVCESCSEEKSRRNLLSDIHFGKIIMFSQVLLIITESERFQRYNSAMLKQKIRFPVVIFMPE